MSEKMDDLHDEIMTGFIQSLRDDEFFNGHKITTTLADGSEVNILDSSLPVSELVAEMGESNAATEPESRTEKGADDPKS